MFWSTGSGEAVLVMLTSDCAGLATIVDALAVLFAEFGSPTVLAAFTVLVIEVPDAVAALRSQPEGS